MDTTHFVAQGRETQRPTVHAERLDHRGQVGLRTSERLL